MDQINEVRTGADIKNAHILLRQAREVKLNWLKLFCNACSKQEEDKARAEMERITHEAINPLVMLINTYTPAQQIATPAPLDQFYYQKPTTT